MAYDVGVFTDTRGKTGGPVTKGNPFVLSMHRRITVIHPKGHKYAESIYYLDHVEYVVVSVHGQHLGFMCFGKDSDYERVPIQLKGRARMIMGQHRNVYVEFENFRDSIEKMWTVLAWDSPDKNEKHGEVE